MIDNTDLRLLNIKKEDELFYKHKIFVVTWQKAKTMEEVSRKLGISIEAATKKASRLRHGGVPLKMFKNERAIENIKGLQQELRKIAIESYTPAAFDKIDPKEFVRVWQSASCRQEVCNHFGISGFAASTKASKLRRLHGVNLKMFQWAAHG